MTRRRRRPTRCRSRSWTTTPTSTSPRDDGPGARPRGRRSRHADARSGSTGWCRSAATCRAPASPCEVVDEHPALLGGVALHPNEAPRLADARRARRGAGRDRAARGAPAGPGRSARPGSTTSAPAPTALRHNRTRSAGTSTWPSALGKALQIHDRDAHDDVLRILAEEGAPERTVLHCFSGDIDDGARVRRPRLPPLVRRHGDVQERPGPAQRPGRHPAGAAPRRDRRAVPDAAARTAGRPNAPYLVPLTVRAMAGVLNVDVPRLCTAISANSERVYGPW